ncbi:MAG: amidohydrolase [Lachnospiraceae bacterium]|nr:amidohydrolase [Lachnospiraceae bacterium]
MKEMIKSLVTEYESKLLDTRHHLHENPELSFQEYKTAEYIRENLKNMGIELQEGISGTSTVGILKGSEPGPCIAFRADIDALPVEENNDLPYKSKTPGIMHACGHDTHVACLLTLADILSSHKELVKGTVKFVFQAAEEKLPGGAKQLCADGVMNDIDVIFGMHCSSGYPMGIVEVCHAVSSAAIGVYEIKIHGKGGHGSSPHNALNPVPVACMVANSLNQILAEKKDPTACGVFTVSYINGGQYPNIITDTVTMGGNVRTLDNDLILRVFDTINAVTKGICEGYGLTCEVTTTVGYPATVNTPRYADVIQEAATAMEYEVIEKATALGGEDFAYYVMEKPGAFFHVGMADPERPITSTPHHNGQFILDERGLRIALETEIAVYLKATGQM